MILTTVTDLTLSSIYFFYTSILEKGLASFPFLKNYQDGDRLCVAKAETFLGEAT